MGAFLQGYEPLILFAILLLVLGPTKLPALARGLGQAVREFRKASQGFYDDVESKPKKESAKPTTSSTSLGPADIDDELLYKLAEKLNISTEGKTKTQLKTEVIAKAKEENLL